MTGLRLIVGAGSCPPGALAQLSIRLLDHVRAAGLRSPRVKVTHDPSGCSRYVAVVGRDQREWLIRLSNHRRPNGTGHPVPHFDLVSIDGATGFDQVLAFVDRIAAGAERWHDPMAGVRQPKQRRRAW